MWSFKKKNKKKTVPGNNVNKRLNASTKTPNCLSNWKSSGGFVLQQTILANTWVKLQFRWRQALPKAADSRVRESASAARIAYQAGVTGGNETTLPNGPIQVRPEHLASPAHVRVCVLLRPRHPFVALPFSPAVDPNCSSKESWTARYSYCAIYCAVHRGLSKTIRLHDLPPWCHSCNKSWPLIISGHLGEAISPKLDVAVRTQLDRRRSPSTCVLASRAEEFLQL